MGYPLPWIKILGFLIGVLFIHQGVYHSIGVDQAPRISVNKLPQIAFYDGTSASLKTYLHTGLPVALVSNLENQVSQGTDTKSAKVDDGACNSVTLSPTCPQVVLTAQEQPGDREFAWAVGVCKGDQDWLSASWWSYQSTVETLASWTTASKFTILSTLSDLQDLLTPIHGHLHDMYQSAAKTTAGAIDTTLKFFSNDLRDYLDSVGAEVIKGYSCITLSVHDHFAKFPDHDNLAINALFKVIYGVLVFTTGFVGLVILPFAIVFCLEYITGGCDDLSEFIRIVTFENDVSDAEVAEYRARVQS